MNEQLGVILFSEKKTSKTLKVNHKTVKREHLVRRLLASEKGKIELTRAARDIESAASLIVLHPDYRMVSIVKVGGPTIKVAKYENLDIFYNILDTVAEFMTSDNTLSKYNWDNEIDFVDRLKTLKLDKEAIGLYDCMTSENYSKKDLLTGDEIAYKSLRARLEEMKGVVATTLLLILADVQNIKKLLFWDGETTIGVVHKDGSNYAIELNKNSYKGIKNQLRNGGESQ